MLMIEPQNLDGQGVGDIVIVPKILATQNNIPIADRISANVHAHLLLLQRPYAIMRLIKPNTVNKMIELTGK